MKAKLWITPVTNIDEDTSTLIDPTLITVLEKDWSDHILVKRYTSYPTEISVENLEVRDDTLWYECQDWRTLQMLSKSDYLWEKDVEDI